MPLTFDDPSIIFDVTKGTILEASAGSGKTTVLTERWVASFIYLLVWEKKSVSEALGMITALTFTKKAATEMKMRIRSRLTDLWDGGELSYFLEQIHGFVGNYPSSIEDILTYLHSIRSSIDDLLPAASIMTINAFVLRMLYENPLELNFDIGQPEDQGHDLSIAEAEAEELLCERLLSHYYKGTQAQQTFEIGVSLCGLSLWNKLFLQLRTLMGRFGEDAVYQGLHQSNYMIWEPKILSACTNQNPKQIIWDLIKDKIAHLKAVLDMERNSSRGGTLTSNNEQFYQQLQKIDQDTLLFLFIKNIIGTYTKPKPTKNDEMNALRDASEYAYQELIDILYCILIPLMVPVSRLCTVILKEKQAETKEISFVESELLFLDALKKESFLTKIQSRIRFLFADEYQDTSDLQKEMFDHILNTKQIIPFFVGDPKQSIYSFRKANVYIFQQTINEFKEKNHKIAYLNTNYRSSKSHVELVNTLFSHIFDDDQAGITYQHQLSKKDEEGRFAYTLALGVEEQLKFNQSDKLNQAYKDALSVIDAYLEDGINPGHIMVLFRNNVNILDFYNHAKKYIPSLPISSSVKNLLWDNEYIAPLLTFLKAIIHPYDDLTIVELLKTPFFRKTDDQITEMIVYAQKIQKNLFDVLDVQEQLLLESFNLLKDKISLEELVSVLIKQLSYEEILRALPNSGDALATLRLFIEESKNINQKHGMSLAEFIYFIDEKKPKANESEFSGEEGKTLRLMTIHSSKGLESPYVVYVHKPKSTETKTKYPQYQKGHIAFDALGRGIIATKVSDLIKIEDTSEEKRLAYVAITRAKKEFIFCGLSSGFRGENLFETQWESFLNKELIDRYPQYQACELNFPEISLSTTINQEPLSTKNYQSRFEELAAKKKIFEEIPEFLSVSLLLDAEFNPDGFYQKYCLHSFDIVDKLNELSDDNIASLNQLDLGSLVHDLLQKFDAPEINIVKQYLDTHHPEKEALFLTALDYAYAYWHSSFYQDMIKNSSSQDKERQVACLIDYDIIVRATADSYVSSDQGHIIVDYKLSINPKNLERYTRQLSYYALLSEMSHYHVDKIFLFSLKEGKEIEIAWDRSIAKEYFDRAVHKSLELLKHNKKALI
ncbi:MAG: UvrD-helicase domain-containing protein [Brevinema sp.]